jgi:hypothetical protein
MNNGKFPTVLSFFYKIKQFNLQWVKLVKLERGGVERSRAEGRRVGPLEVARPIPAVAATAASAGGLQELVPAGRRPNDRDPLALA